MSRIEATLSRIEEQYGSMLAEEDQWETNWEAMVDNLVRDNTTDEI